MGLPTPAVISLLLYPATVPTPLHQVERTEVLRPVPAVVPALLTASMVAVFNLQAILATWLLAPTRLLPATAKAVRAPGSLRLQIQAQPVLALQLP